MSTDSFSSDQSSHSSSAGKIESKTHPAVDLLRNALKQDSFISGSCDVPVDFCTLYYSTTPTSAVRLNLAEANEQDLAQLITSCDAAPFGRGTETVMDESYRKALKLELSQFAMPFEPAATDILGKISRELVQSDTILTRFVRAEPYKLNIYDKGCFFKSHQDTPRSNTMFGSLVVSFPTPHQGGSLVLKENEQEWTFDSGKMLASSTPKKSQVAWVAFYSDVFHEVLPVTSGTRITLTYNLYFEEVASLLRSSPSTNLKYNSVKGAIRQLIDDKSVLPEGGYLCFGLAHQYSIKRDGESNFGHRFNELSMYLKGGDAVIFSAAKELGLKPRLQVIYKAEEVDFEDMDDEDEEMNGYMVEAPLDHCGQVEDPADLFEWSDCERIVGHKAGDKDMFWITLETDLSNTISTSYVGALGNEAGLEYVYGNICMTIDLDRN